MIGAVCLKKDRLFQVYDSKSQSGFLSDEQDYVGQCILVFKRDCSSLAELTDDELVKLRNGFEKSKRA